MFVCLFSCEGKGRVYLEEKKMAEKPQLQIAPVTSTMETPAWRCKYMGP